MQCSSRILRFTKFLMVQNVRKCILHRTYHSIATKSHNVSMVTSLFNQFLCSPKSQYQYLCTTAKEAHIVDYVTYERVCEETLESLADYTEEIIENAQNLKSADVAYSSGVLTINFGAPYGTYVINRQSPNRQIWLSSPTSGPKRYDYDLQKSCWIYRHDGRTLHQLLQEEFPSIVKCKIDFSKCSYSSLI